MRHFHRNPRLHSRRLGSELLLYDEKKNKVISLNETAALVWNFCDGKHSKEDMVSHMTDCYDVAVSKVRKDIDKTLARLKSVGVIT